MDNKLDHVSIMQGKIESLHHVCKELLGVIGEFRALPTRCLEDRMFKTADRYRKRVDDNAPDSTMFLSMTLGVPVQTPVYVNSGRRLLIILRKAGAPEGKEAEALRTFLWLRDSLSLRLDLQTEGVAERIIVESLKGVPMVPAPKTGTEGQKVVELAFAHGAIAGRARFWLNSLLEEIETLNAKVRGGAV